VTGDRTASTLVKDPLLGSCTPRRGVSDYTLYDEAGIFARTGVPPENYVLVAFAAARPLVQPAAIPVWCEKTAAKLLPPIGGGLRTSTGFFSAPTRAYSEAAREPSSHYHLAACNARLIPLVRDVGLLTCT